MVKLQKIKMESLRSQVYMQLKSQLMQGVWKIGEKLPSESELCASLGVSRVTVRAAIQQLEILGLVETRHGGGNQESGLREEPGPIAEVAMMKAAPSRTDQFVFFAPPPPTTTGSAISLPSNGSLLMK